MNRSRLCALAVVCLLALLTFALGAAHLESQSMWRDEVDAIRFARAPWHELIGNLPRPGWNGPLYFLLLRVWIAAAGSGPYSVRFLSLLCSVVIVPLTFVIGRRLLDHESGLFAATIAASAPYLAWYGLEAKMYTWVTALGLLAVYALRRAFDGSGWRWWPVQIAATAGAAYSHIVAALLIPVQLAMYLAWAPRSRRQWVGAAAGAGVLLVPYLPLLAWQVPLLVQRRATGFPPTPVRGILSVLVTGWSVGPYPDRDWLRALPKALAGLATWGLAFSVLPAGALASARLLPRRIATRAAAGVLRSNSRGTHREPRSQAFGRARKAISIALWLTVAPAALGAISLWQPIFTDRYLIWCAPSFFLLVGLGISSLRRLGTPGRLLAVPVCVLLATANLGSTQAQLAGAHKADFRAVAAFIAEGGEFPGERTGPPPTWAPAFHTFLPMVRAGSGPAGASRTLVLFQIPHARHAFEYYYRGPEYDTAEGLYTNHREADGSYLMSQREASEQMPGITAGYEQVWMVATEVDSWDERRLVEGWLREHLRLEFVAHFVHIDVYRYAAVDQD
jgi:hypothetical protein